MSDHYIRSLDLPGRMTRHPYQALLIAAGVGYVIAGGLFTRFTFTVLRVGIRIGAIPSVQRKLIDVAQSTLQTRSPTSSPS